ncbi:tRNA(ANN) t(6)A37 threonylcarbamoyladenosine modification protein, partial [Mycoplasmopsis edwardii]
MEEKYSNLFVSTTDTVVGIGGKVSNQTLKEIYEIKKRPLDKKIIILVSSYEQLKQFKEW